MRETRQRLLPIGISILGILMLSPALLGQVSPEALTTDWSSRHVIFSKSASAAQSKLVSRNPRYAQQQARQSAASLSQEDITADPTWERRSDPPFHMHHRPLPLRRDWSQDMGGGATVGALNYPAKYSFQSTTANCATDFVVYPTGLAGTLNQASIVAFNNIYSGCGGSVPSVYWAYDTGGQVTTSPVFSRDGSQIAFVQTDGSGNAMLVLLRWAASTTETITNPTPLSRLPNSSYPGSAVPCMTTGQLQTSGQVPTADANSSVFYDYDDDIAYIGDESGWLHKITPVFNGVPAEVTSYGWPVQVNPDAPTALTSPVYDSTSGLVFVADAGGYLYRVGPGTAFVATSGQLDYSLSADGGPGITQAPVVDSTAELVYVFAPSDGSGGCTGGADCTAVYELAVDFPEGATGGKAIAGASSVEPTPPNPLYIGAFDSIYLNSGNATGHLYVCGNTGGPPILAQITIQDGILGTVSPGPDLSSGIGSNPACSPVSDILNPNAGGGATEWIFVSTENGGVASDCSAGGCIFNFKDTPWLPSTHYAVGQEILDSNLHVEVVTVAGTSGASAPFWTTSTGGQTTDGSVKWLDQGSLSASTPAAWKSHHHYAGSAEILDGNNNVQLVTTAGNSGGSMPAFNSTAGLSTSDGTVTWTNVGAIATAAMATAGGTSGIIMDNTVASGTEAGASQVYFSTLGNQACGTTGNGGCAIQASQSALQ